MSDVVINVVESATNVNVTEPTVEVDVTETVVEVSASTAGIQGASYNQGDPIYVTVRNATGATLTKGTIVYTSGAQGNHTLVQKANASGDATSARTLGWVSANIANNADGFVVVEGYLDGIDTDHIAEGSQLYLSTVAGGFTATKPQAPTHLVYVGVVTKSNPGNGRVLVKVQNGYELEELHDVKITSPANNDVLTYDSATDLWINKLNAADGVTSITATAPLTGGTITSTGSIGLDQTALNIAQSQVTNLVSDLAGKANLAGGNAFTGNQTIVADSATDRPVIIKGFSGQTANLLEARSSADVLLTRIDRNGAVSATYWGPVGTGLTGYLEWITSTPTFYSGAAATTGMIIKGAASQTGSMLQLQNSAGNITANFTAPVNNVNRLNLGGTDLSATLGITVHASGGVGQVIRAAASQSANIQEWQDSAGTILTRISPVGQVVSNSQAFFGSGAASIPNTRLNVATGSSSVVGQVIRGASGQTADLLQVQDNAGTNYLSVNNVGSLLFGTGSGSFLSGANGRVNVQLSGDNVGLTVRAFGGQTADLLKIQNNAGVDLVRVDNAGHGIFPTVLAGALTGSIGVQMAVQPTAATTPGFAVRGAVNQLEDTLEIQNSAGTVLGGRNANAQIFTGSTAPIQTAVGAGINGVSATGTVVTISTTNAHNLTNGDRVTIAGLTPAGYNGTYIISGVSTFSFNVANTTTGVASGSGTVVVDAQASIVARSAGTRGLIVRGVSGQAVNLLEFQDNSANTLASVNGAGLISSARQISVTQTNAGETMFFVRGATSQTGDAIAVRDVSANTIAGFSATGRIYSGVSGTGQTFLGGLTLGSGPVASQMGIVAGAATTVGAVIRGAASQSADLQQWQTSAGVARVRITPTGEILATNDAIRGPQLYTFNYLNQLQERNSGGELTMQRQTATTTNPGANYGRIYFRDGTNAGTLKLVVRAGAAGAETTILDNIPQ